MSFKKRNIHEADSEMTAQKVRDIFNEIELTDYSLDDYEELETETIKINGNTYNIYRTTNETNYIITLEDYENYLKDVASEFESCLPDGFYKFFDFDSLYESMLEDNGYLYQCVEFINDNTSNVYYAYIKEGTGDFDGVGYVIVKEEY